MSADEKDREFLTLSFLEELRRLCDRIADRNIGFETELDALPAPACQS
jgi:hypothetical protein